MDTDEFSIESVGHTMLFIQPRHMLCFILIFHRVVLHWLALMLTNAVMNKELPTFIFNHLTLPTLFGSVFFFLHFFLFFLENPKKIQSCFVYTFRFFARCLLHIKIKCRNMVTNAKSVACGLCSQKQQSHPQ